MINDKKYYCRICGLKQPIPPWGHDGQNPTRDICSCCGAEFGYEDSLKSAILDYRRKWLDSGALWFSPKEKPTDWNLKEQLKQIPEEFK